MRVLELKIPPLAVFLIAALAMWVLARLSPVTEFALPAAHLVVFGLMLVGGTIALAGVRAFHRKETSVDPMNPDKASSLVDAGIYRYTRNPMYLGLGLALLAWGVFLGNMASFAVLPAFVLYLTRFQIKPEERVLLDKFGPDYATYMNDVRRWL
jgi:protein-S-isoprenylcysteine O-methyltransferase Ste14